MASRQATPRFVRSDPHTALPLFQADASSHASSRNRNSFGKGSLQSNRVEPVLAELLLKGPAVPLRTVIRDYWPNSTAFRDSLPRTESGYSARLHLL